MEKSWWEVCAGTRRGSRHWDFWDLFLVLQVRCCLVWLCIRRPGELSLWCPDHPADRSTENTAHKLIDPSYSWGHAHSCCQQLQRELKHGLSCKGSCSNLIQHIAVTSMGKLSAASL